MKDHQRYASGISVQYHTAGNSDTKNIVFSYQSGQQRGYVPGDPIIMNAGKELFIDKITRVLYTPYGNIKESPTPGETTLISQIFFDLESKT